MRLTQLEGSLFIIITVLMSLGAVAAVAVKEDKSTIRELRTILAKERARTRKDEARLGSAYVLPWRDNTYRLPVVPMPEVRRVKTTRINVRQK